MTFAPVKSDPWKKGLAALKLKTFMWSDAFWGRLCKNEEALCGTGDLSGCSILMIVQEQRRIRRSSVRDSGEKP